MKSRLTLPILFIAILTLLFIQFSNLYCSISASTSRTIKVPDDYATIQEAINAAAPGDTIYVSSGTYYERIVVNKTLTLIGEDPLTTIIDGQQRGPIVNITANYVKIMNFTITNGRYYVAIWVENPASDYILCAGISNNIITDSYAGVILSRNIGTVIGDNVIRENQVGIRAYSSVKLSIARNTIANSIFHGIHLHTSCQDSSIEFNVLSNNKYGIHIETSYNINITRNEIISDVAKEGYGIRLTTSNNISIVGNNIKFNYRGIVFWENSINNHIYYNNFINNTIQVEHYNTPITGNIWDTNVCPGAKGNYWSDYKGVDDGSGLGRWGEERIAGDGIGDTLIPHLDVDYYPLMHPWSPWPIAFFTYYPEKPRVLEPVTFDASLSFGDIVLYEWDFGDGNITSVTEPIIIHTFQEVGNYTVALTVKTREGLTNSTSVLVSVLPFRLIIDVYTQREPYSGKGFNQSSDAFAPQELVILYALVTYNDAPVADKLVSFAIIYPNETEVIRSNETNEYGIATIFFRLEAEAMGTYRVIATVEVAGYTVADYLHFKVGWIVNIVEIETVDVNGFIKTQFRKGEILYLNIYLQNIAFTPKNVTLTITVYDEKSTPIGATGFQMKVEPGWNELRTVLAILIPQWCYAGLGSVHVNAFTDWVVNNGTPYCPEKSTYLNIVP